MYVGVSTMKIAKQLCMAAAMGILSVAPVLAECSYPKKPADPPNGAQLAKRDVEAAQQGSTERPGRTEMAAALKLFKQYDAEVKAYADCMNVETEAMLNALGDKATTAEIKRIKDKQDLKTQAAFDEEIKVADAFAAQRQAYLTDAPK
jgi:hypothetical protein